MTISNAPTIVWFRKDLRLQDNPALAAALHSGAPVVPVFVHAPDEAGRWAPGAASKWWLHQALQVLGGQFADLGGKLVLRRGDSLAELRDVIEKSGARRVYWNRRYEAALREVDATVKRALRDDGIEVESFNGSLLNEPHTVSTGSGNAYKVYTPYWRKVKERKVAPPIEIETEGLCFPDQYPRSVALDSLELLPKVQWYRKFYPHWEVGEAAAQTRLRDFLDGPVAAYDTDRDRPDRDGTSSLSPHLHWGHISPGQVLHALSDAHDPRATGSQTFAKEIYWREFAYNVLYHFPHTPDAPLQEKYADFPWETDRAALAAWQAGRTGYPIVDAGMRQLYETGWMHNRVRMIVSSLLVKHLLQSWNDGARWFWDTLVDADLASNTLGWQWSGGCGADAAPYFRIFNPMIQGKKFDPDGHYVRQWLPELRKLPNRYIHEPWEAPDGILRQAGITLGEDYPRPIIDHKQGRERALAALDQLKNENA
ncbi:MAG: DNA photolyase family protein [Xanthomonadaceae bacterium]|nr:DNA photolyase family protein [Xanthomonadaceae bacterium]